ncbi:hypothetical protein LCGC14_3085730 [marine sediment metagenome]|uniref:Uncharacterized protein n=1 Tax=marine sediment metagenome TaxID=412755 RepID=A0A0F8WCM0_9ZZZZ
MDDCEQCISNAARYRDGYIKWTNLWVWGEHIVEDHPESVAHMALMERVLSIVDRVVGTRSSEVA